MAHAWLEREVGPSIVQVHLLGGHDFIGTGEGSLVPIASAAVARRQCTIVREGQLYRLRDVRSTRAGTLVNYRYVREAVLVPGDQVQVGETVLRFRQLPLRPSRPPAGAKVIHLGDRGGDRPDGPRASSGR